MIDITKIPQHESESLTCAVLNAVRAFYATPENQAAFEKWLAEETMKNRERG